MIQLTPLEETVAVRQLIRMNTRKVLKEGLQKGLQKGRKEGTQHGELIGKIHATQRFMKRPITSKKELLEQSTKELRAILKQLEALLKAA